MLRWIVLVMMSLLIATAGCNLAKDTADTSEQGGTSAVDLAETMSTGTIGEADYDTGETPEDEEEYDEEFGEE